MGYCILLVKISITKEFLGWEMSFYDSEKGRKRGISYLRSKHLGQYPLYQFELRLEDVLDVSVAVPFIPEDRRRVFNIGDLSKPSRGKE